MAGLKTLLGLYPKTTVYELKRKQLQDEYNALKEFETSEELARFKELEQFCKSTEFQSKKSELLSMKYKGSEEFRKETDYKRLKKDSSLKKYLKTVSSPDLQSYNEIKSSDALQKFIELEKKVNSVEFRVAQKDKKTFNSSEDYKKLQEYNVLKHDSGIKQFVKFDKSKELANYNAVHGSDKLKRFEELSEYLKSEAFLEKKKYLTLSPKLRWKQSDAFKKFDEFEQLKKSEKFKWYINSKNNKKFDWFNTWSMTFEDDFDTGKLDTKRWITKYFWGEQMIQESYSLGNEKQCFTDKNLEFNGSVVRIITRKEAAEGKAWIKDHGFLPRKFDYTSGIINTGKSFRQKYGLFEAKIRFSNPNSIMNAFWMVGDRSKPHLDVAKAYNKCSVGLTLDEKQKYEKAIGRKRFSNDFHIFSMEWSPNSIIWKINGLEVKTINQNIPDQEMYLNFSASLYSDSGASGLPSSMEIDWVRCYSKN
jgi:beta-glucanase (GH16 family)